jgi:hypothetical protein
MTAATDLSERIDRLAWPAIAAAIEAQGFATTGPLLAPARCRALIDLYATGGFRSRVVMARHGFGRGEYKYFADPLPDQVQQMRALFYPRLAPVARGWAPALGLACQFPDRLDQFGAICRAHGQTKPTPLLLRYEAGDYNCLHQDLYGDIVFPLQAAILLSRPEHDFTGGEFLLVEQRPRAQSRGHVVPLVQGEAVIFATRQRPVAGTRGTYRVNLRHGVSTVRTGTRFTLGIIFHDAA